MAVYLLFLFLFMQQASCLIPPKFQWKTIDYVWESNKTRDEAIQRGDYIPENNMPTGLARWKNKLFITIPRIKTGVPSSLNYIYLNGTQGQPLNPYPSWKEAFIPQLANNIPSNSTVVCALRVYVDSYDRLWTVDNGVLDITGEIKQISNPSILVFDLNTDQLLHKFVLEGEVLRDSSVFTSIVVDFGSKSKPNETYAYITDMGSSAIIVFSLQDKEAWRVENPYFHFDPHAGVYKVGGIDFYWSDGISSATLSKPKNHGYRNLYFHPTSSTKQFVMSTKLLRNKTATTEDIFNGVKIVGDRGPLSQSTACAFEEQNNVLFYTQLSKNGLGCWNIDKPFTKENTPLILSDCNLMEFPSDIKLDQRGNLWMLSNRQSRFLYGELNVDQVNFRVLAAPTTDLIRDTPCEKLSTLGKVLSSMRPKSADSKSSFVKDTEVTRW